MMLSSNSRPRIDNPEGLQAFWSIAGVKPGDRRKLQVDTLLGHSEQLQPMPDELPTGHTWYLPALIYTFVGLDRSLFKIFALQLGRGLEIPTFKSADLLLPVNGVDNHHQWFSTVQGLPVEHAQAFADFLSTFAVNNRRTGEMVFLDLRPLPTQRGRYWAICPRSARGGFRVEEGRAYFVDA